MSDLFVRSPDNPILVPSGAWWEARGVLNPGAAAIDGRVALIYRAVGADGLSRFGLAWSTNGERIDSRGFYYESPPGDPSTRLGVEDPRLTLLDDKPYLTYTKVSVGPATEPPLPWEFAPFILRSAVARVGRNVAEPSVATPSPLTGSNAGDCVRTEASATSIPVGTAAPSLSALEASPDVETDSTGGAGVCNTPLRQLAERPASLAGDVGRARQEPAPTTDRSEDPIGRVVDVGIILSDTNTKDSVLFPSKIDGRYAALVREYPSIQYTTSTDLQTWSEPVPVMEPNPGTWEGERIGAGPPPMLTPWGWLLLYHGNEYLHQPGNRRLYRMGLAVLDRDKPWLLRYRHSEPIFEPAESYETEGPVGNVVFGTGLIERGDQLYLYYGAGDGVIGLATAPRPAIDGVIENALGPPATE